MADSRKISFEERLTQWAGTENLKAAKNLLKGNSLAGVWRDKNNHLRGCFKEKCDKIMTTVIPGDTPECICSCGNSDHSLCSHAAAIIMYAGRFGAFNDLQVNAAPNYLAGLKQESWQRLAERAPEKPNAQLTIEAASDAPHAPSTWENISVTVRINSRERSFPGNLNNLRQLYFEKSLSVVIHYDHFELQEQQIIRFLALYGEPDGSKITLNSDMTAEFFHCLTGYPRFYKSGRQLKIHSEKAEVVVVKNAGRFYPGLRISGALLPVTHARVITGRSGCWIGAGGEYFFIPATCEVGFLRNFFRSGAKEPAKDGISEEKIRRFPFPIINLKAPEPETVDPEILLDGAFDAGNKLVLSVRYSYCLKDDYVVTVPRSGELVGSGLRFFRRNTAVERAFEQMLTMFGFVFDGKTATLNGAEKAGLFFDALLPDIADGPFSPSICPNLLKIMNPIQTAMHCFCKESSDNLHRIGFKVYAGQESISWQNLFDACQNHTGYLIHNSKICRIPEKLGEFIRALPEMTTRIDSDNQEFFLPHFNANFFYGMTRELPDTAIPELSAIFTNNTLIRKEENTDRVCKFCFSGTLRNYQKTGVDFLCRMTERGFNVILADEMGLGKTVQLLALLGRKLFANSMPALIICPASLTANWVREAEKFLPGVRVFAPSGNDRKTLWQEPDKYDIGVISYTAARLAGEKLKLTNFSYLILDEAQHIKNPGSGNARNCKNLRSEHRIVLSGTPLENSPEDLWSIFDFLHPGMLGACASFKKRYSYGSDFNRELACRISPFILRRTKAEVASDLPERSEKIIFCDMSSEQRKLYDEILADGRETLENCGNDKLRGNAAIFNTLMRLRRVCCAPGLLDDGKYADTPSAKEELLYELMDEIFDSSHKMLLFSQFTSMLKKITPVLKSKNIPFEYLDGATRNRQEKVDNFNNDRNIALFLLSLKAGGTGLNLTSADTVIIYDPWWNPAAESQAADRTHRIGQTKPVTIYKLVMRDSIEEKIVALQGRKRELFNQVVEASQEESVKLSMDELKELLEK